MLAGAAALALGAWLAAPIHGGEPRRALDVCLVDVSASVVRTRPGWSDLAGRWLRGQLEGAAAQERDVLAIAYARDVAMVSTTDPADALGSIARAGLASDLAAALDAVEAQRRGREVARVALWSDREWTGRDPSRPLAALAAGGAAIEWAELPPPALADAALVGLTAPPRVEPGAPLSVAAVVAVRTRGELAPRTLRISCEVRDAAGARAVERSIAWPRSDEPAAVRVDLGAAREGWTSIRARVAFDDGAMADPVPENDAASASVRAGAKPLLGIVTGAGGRLDWAVAAPPHETFTVQPIAVADVARSLGELDALAALDLDPRLLPLDRIEDFVRRGGGFFVCGGEALLAGLMAAPGALALLPIELDPGGEGARDVILLVDRSGSMSGETYAAVRVAAVDLALAAPPDDAVSIRCFTDRLDAQVALRAAGEPAERERIEPRVRGLAPPGGPTDVLAVLDTLARERESAPRRALVLLLSDGRDQDARGATPERCLRTRGALESARAELHVLAFGARADREFLGALAGERGVRAADSPADLAALFERALAEAFVVQSPAPVAASDSAQPGSVAAEIAAAVRASGGGALPPLARMLAVRARPDGEVAVSTLDGRAVLALRRDGLGLAAAWASSPEPAWGGAWNELPALWGPLLRALARGRPSEAPLRARLRSNEVEVEGVPLEWPAHVRAELRSRAGDREVAAGVDLALPPVAPGRDPRALRRGHLAVAESIGPGPAELRVLDAAGRRLATLTVEIPAPDELAFPPRRVGIGPPAPEASPVRARAAPRSPGRAAGVACLAAGVAALALGAFLRLRSGQARLATGR